MRCSGRYRRALSRFPDCRFNYALLSQASAWIQRTTGLNFAGTLADGRDTQLQ
ncbi:hypothetical protein [Rothia nasimurium]|uniref:hypothetical protein n=1 Tax=Rothia nasimurium TaxID=85336 RepID=UPI001F2BE562|nr:hypothetical protein [Rothia nasimurium]